MAAIDLDYQRPRRVGDIVAYRRFERAAGWLVLPQTMTIAARADGSPDFQIDLVRARDASLEGYGAIDFRVRPGVDLDSARRTLGEDDVQLGSVRGGWLRLLVREPGKTGATTVVPPLAFAPNGLGVVRLAAMLTAESASLLKRALVEGIVLVEAWAELCVDGVSPRIEASVEIDVDALRRALPADASSAPVRRSDVVAALVKPGVLSGAPSAGDAFETADAVADRLRVLAATLVPSPGMDVTEWWNLSLATGEARLRWDLRDAVTATRAQPLRFDPVALVRQATAGGGLERLVVTREVVDLRTGDVPVLVTANIPEKRSLVLACGADLDAPARLPDRPSAIRETVELEPPLDRSDVLMRFSPRESPEYGVQTFAVVRTDGGVREWRSTRAVHAGRDVRLTPDDFAVRFLPVQASPQLLATGEVSVTATWGGDSQQLTIADATGDTLVVPRAAATVTCTCVVSKAGRTIRADVPVGDGPIALDLPLFREAGSHTVQIDVTFPDGVSLVAIELKPEAADDRDATVVSFTPASATRRWTWLASSPLTPGFRYRPFTGGAAAVAWSAPQSPFDALRLDARALVESRPPA
jgi:hypothetical protein